jgi:hypothetical protein
MVIEKLLKMLTAVLNETRTQIRSMESEQSSNPNGISSGLNELYRFLEEQANLTRDMFLDQCRESECSCYKCGRHFWLTMPVKQERELGPGLPETCIECWELDRKATNKSAFHDPKYRYRRETIEQAQKRRAREDGEASA